MSDKPNNNLITMSDPDSATAEAFRTLRTNISLKDIDSKTKVINVISAVAKESKSTTIINLAYVYSQLGKNVLLIDLDLRLPTIHKKLNLKNECGITELLTNNATWNDCVVHYLPRFDVLLSGGKNPYSTELIQSEAFAKLIQKLKETYDLVLIDCPPIGLVTDGIITSTIADGTILCVASNRADRKDLERAKDLLEQFNVNVLGVVMTRMPVGSRYYYKYKYKYDYSYRYYYNSPEDKKKKW